MMVNEGAGWDVPATCDLRACRRGRQLSRAAQHWMLHIHCLCIFIALKLSLPVQAQPHTPPSPPPQHLPSSRCSRLAGSSEATASFRRRSMKGRSTCRWVNEWRECAVGEVQQPEAGAGECCASCKCTLPLNALHPVHPACQPSLSCSTAPQLAWCRRLVTISASSSDSMRASSSAAPSSSLLSPSAAAAPHVVPRRSAPPNLQLAAVDRSGNVDRMIGTHFFAIPLHSEQLP